MGRGRLTTCALAAALALGLTAAPAASAKLPPSGKYGCTIPSPSIEGMDQYLGELRIKGNKYKINSSRWGEMRNPSGKKIRFKSGAWKGLFRGEWERGESVLNPGTYFVEIELTEIESGWESTYCTKES